MCLSLLIVTFSVVNFCTSSTLLFDHAHQPDASAPKPPNVLMLISDDMRPDIGAYGSTSGTPMVTPNLDRLASRSMLFERAYVQQAVCSPSRTSLLTGRRPDTTRVHDLVAYWRKVAGNFTTLPQYFKQNGYNTAGSGKVFHPGRASGRNDPISWTEPFFSPDQEYWKRRTNNVWFAADEPEIYEHPLPDMQIANAAVEILENLTMRPNPFFLAVGFLKPHLPFLFPRKFLDFYPPNLIKLPDNPFAPVDMPQVAWSDYDELRKYDDVSIRYGYGSINTTLPDDITRSFRRAYFASISYVDSLVGQVLSRLAALRLAANTVVLFIGDHGWQLGEHGEWCKHTNFERATRAPMLLSVPGLTDAGAKTDALVEFVDIFPTLVDAVGLPAPMMCPKKSRKVDVCVEGSSLMPLLGSKSNNVSRVTSDPSTIIRWKSAAFSQYPRMIVSGDILMGYSMRTHVFRYTEWIPYDADAHKPLWKSSRVYAELYDHSVDAEENRNLADDERYAIKRTVLSKQLRAGWRYALPFGAGTR